MFWFGIPSGHDFEVHLNSWIDAARQWHEGIFYPRWASMAHFGYGEPHFIFYPPASWMFGALLGKLLPWGWVPFAYMWIVLMAAGCSMFALARNWLPRRDAVFAAAVYAVNPYHMVIVYWRSAFAELMAGVWLPLLLLWVLRLDVEGQRRKAVACLALVVAAVWLTNAPAAVMATYSLALLVLVMAWLHRSPRALLLGAAACALGIALAGFYVLPAAYEESWVTIRSVLTTGLRPEANFLFSRWTFPQLKDADHHRFNLLVSIVALAQIAALAVAAWLTRRQRSEQSEIWRALAIWSGVAAVLMLPVTFVLWSYLPELRFMQFPWRWLLSLNVAFALMVSMGMRRWWARSLVCVAMLIVLAGVWRNVQPPWWDTASDINDMRDDQEEGRGYEGVNEYLPRGANPRAVSKDAPEVVIEGGDGAVEMDDWGPEQKSFTVRVAQPSRLVLKLFYYPAWKVDLNDRWVKYEIQPGTGQIVVPVKPGENRVRLVFSRTRDRLSGAALSGFAGIIVAVIAFLPRREKQLATN